MHLLYILSSQQAVGAFWTVLAADVFMAHVITPMLAKGP